MNGHDPIAAGLLILALAPVELDAVQVAISFVGLVLMVAAWVTWNAARKRNSSPLTYLAISLVVLGFGLVVAPPLLALATLG